MNFLAHAYLSFDNKEVLVGNMISDFVKGNDQYQYRLHIQKGITLHRRIDEFTDRHPAVAEAKKIFRPYYRLYSAPLIDLAFDHFLANDPAAFPGNSLKPFTQKVYKVLEEYSAHLPLRFLPAFTYMQMENWLWHYKTVEGIQKSFSGLISRSVYISGSGEAASLFVKHYNLLQECYERFFENVKIYAKEQYDQLLT